MKKERAMIFTALIFLALALTGCNQKPGGSSPSAPSTATAPAAEKMIYIGDLELSKVSPVLVTVEETNECSITTMVLPGGTLNLDIAITPKGGTTTHASVTTRSGQQFTFQIGNTTVGYTAKLK
jgi:hypothetical protein